MAADDDEPGLAIEMLYGGAGVFGDWEMRDRCALGVRDSQPSNFLAPGLRFYPCAARRRCVGRRGEARAHVFRTSDPLKI